MREFLDLAKSRFGRIIIDAPPLMSVTDAAILSTQADGVLLVVKAESVPRKAAMDARDQLLEVNATLLGVVFNNIQTQRNGYFYNSYYRYHSYYTGKDDGPNPRHRRPPQPGVLGWVKNQLDHFKQKSKHA